MTRALLLLSILTFTVPARADVKEIERLIDDLMNVSKPGVGYSASFSGSEFLPYDDSEQLGPFVIGGTYRERSATLRKLVENGAEAVPVLVQHLGDTRKIKMEPVSGFMWMSFDDEYDFNRQTRKHLPAGVNRSALPANERDSSHHVTVGDMCFVALGQIVNRSFRATRYQPSGGVVVNSPTYSKVLRDTITSEWKGLTRDRHRQLLIEDFERADHEYRRSGAYLRLSLYYPEVVEELVLKELAEPTFDVFKTNEFVRTLQSKVDPKEQKHLYDQFIRDNGEIYAPAVMDELFDNLDWSEEREAQRKGKTTSLPRNLLILLFKQPEDVKISDRPFLKVRSHTERSRLIMHMTHDKSRRIGDVVQQQFLANISDDYFAAACLQCLANRGYGAFLNEQLKKVDLTAIESDKWGFHIMQAIGTSKDPVVTPELIHVLKTARDEDYFMAALPAASKNEPEVLVWATRLLGGLPDDTGQGRQILSMIGERFPDKAAEIYKRFHISKGPQRANTIAEVLWYGSPHSQEILLPLLDDQRELKKFAGPMRVCDRAAQALSHSIEDNQFRKELRNNTQDAQILRLKEYFKTKAAKK